MGILVASPRPAPPPPPAVPWPGVASMTWTVPDLVPEGDDVAAHALHLLRPDSHGLMLVQDGVRGLGMPQVQRWASTAPAVHGSAWRGCRVEERLPTHFASGLVSLEDTEIGGVFAPAHDEP